VLSDAKTSREICKGDGGGGTCLNQAVILRGRRRRAPLEGIGRKKGKVNTRAAPEGSTVLMRRKRASKEAEDARRRRGKENLTWGKQKKSSPYLSSKNPRPNRGVE